MTTTFRTPTLYEAAIVEPLSLVKSQPYQVMISTTSVVIMASFAGHSGLVPWYIGYVLAVGIEWAWLRGIAYDSQAPSRWGIALSWVAVIIIVLWGGLWSLIVYKVIPDPPGTYWGIGLAIAHIVPIAVLSLCSAMAHRTAHIARHQQQSEADRARLEFEQQQAAEDARLARWIKAQETRAEQEAALLRTKAEIRAAGRASKAHAASASDAADALPESINAGEQKCPGCGAHIESRPKWLAARRWGRCSACKEAQG